MSRTESLEFAPPVTARSTGLARLAQRVFYLVRIQAGATAATYGMAVNVFLLLRFALGEDSELVALANMVAPWITGGALLSFAISLIAPYRAYWLLWSVPGVVVFVWWNGLLFIPGRPLLSPDTNDPFTVATFNLKHIRSNIPVPEGTRASIEAMDVDLLGVQEFSDAASTDGLDDLFPYSVRQGKLAVFSHFPLSEGQRIVRELPYDEEQLVALRVTAQINTTTVSVYVAHPQRPTMEIRPVTFDDSILKADLAVLTGALRQDPYPVILLCDCNFSPVSESYANMTDLLDDTWHEAGFGLGFTAPARKDDTPFPVMRSDYVWHSAEFAARAIRVESDHGLSDHFPVWAELGWVD